MDGLSYTVRVTPNNEKTGEFSTNRELTDGIECDGYLIIGFRDGDVRFEGISGISVDDLMQYLRDDHKCAGIVMQAAVIAKGYREAWDIHKGAKARKSIETLSEMLGGALGRE